MFFGIAITSDVGEGLFRIGPPLCLFEGEGGRIEPVQTLFFDSVFDGLIESVEFLLLLAVAKLVGFLEIILVIKRLWLSLKFIHEMELKILQELIKIGLGVGRIIIQNFLEQRIRLFVIAVANQNLRPLEKRGDVHIALDDRRFLLGLDFRSIAPHQFVYAAKQVLHKAQFREILRLEIEHLFRKIIGIHIPIARNQIAIAVGRHERDETRPFIFDPNSIEIVRFRPHNQHDFRRIEGRENIGLVQNADLLFQSDSREKDLIAFFRQLVVNLLSQDRIFGPLPRIIGFLVANEDIKRIFLLGDSENVFLNRGDFFGFGLVLLTSYHVGFGKGVLVIDVLNDGLE